MYVKLYLSWSLYYAWRQFAIATTNIKIERLLQKLVFSLWSSITPNYKKKVITLYEVFFVVVLKQLSLMYTIHPIHTRTHVPNVCTGLPDLNRQPKGLSKPLVYTTKLPKPLTLPFELRPVTKAKAQIRFLTVFRSRTYFSMTITPSSLTDVVTTRMFKVYNSIWEYTTL